MDEGSSSIKLSQIDSLVQDCGISIANAQLISFLHIVMTHVVEILPHIRQKNYFT